jgi:citrate lyase subunit beta / citryl-CoA lyase
MAGRANGLQVIDGPFLKVRDLEALRYAAHTASYGFDGKWALTPTRRSCSTRSTRRARSCSTSPGTSSTPTASRPRRDNTGAVMFGDEMIDEASAKIANSFVARGERSGMKRTPQ